MSAQSFKSGCKTVLAFAILGVMGLLPMMSQARAAAHAPLGYQLMCLKNPSECRASGPAMIEVTPDIMSLLKRVNILTNAVSTPHAVAGFAWSCAPTAQTRC